MFMLLSEQARGRPVARGHHVGEPYCTWFNHSIRIRYNMYSDTGTCSLSWITESYGVRGFWVESKSFFCPTPSPDVQLDHFLH